MLRLALPENTRQAGPGRGDASGDFPAYKKLQTSQDCVLARRFRTEERCHLPPPGDRMARSFNASAISAKLTAPNLRTVSKIGKTPAAN